MQQEATLLALGEVCDEIDACDRAVVSGLWADFHEATSQFAYARVDLEQALARYAQRADRASQAHILSRMGEIALMEGDIDVAEQHYRRALEMLKDAGRVEQLTLSDSHDSKDTAHPTDSLTSTAQRDEGTVRAQSLLGLGVVMRQRGEYDDASAMLGEALAIYSAQGNQPEVATALTRLGGVAFLRRNFGDALDAWNRALSIRRAIGDRESEGSSLLNIAQAHTSMGDYGAALPLLRQALDIQRAVGNRWWENAVWNALGIVALAVGDYTEAQRCISVAFRLCVAVGDEAGAAIMEFNLGQVERECGDYQAALDRLERSRQWAQENDDPEFEAQCLTELALTAQVAGLDTAAERYANDALFRYAALEVKATTTTDLATLALIHLARGEVASALAHIDNLLEIHAQSEPHQIEYPQRDLYVAAIVNWAGGRSEHAALLLQRAYALVQERAANISDETLRRSYLDNVRINREVIAMVERTITPAPDSAR
jgi:tetratricopeptide (TPR) repeat protein